MWQAHTVLLEQQHASFFQPAMVSRVSCYPFFKGQHFQSIKFPFFKGIQGYCKISLLQGYPGPEHPTCLLHWYPRPEHQTFCFKGIQVQSITLPLLQGYQGQSIKFPFLKGIQRQRLQLPFFKGQRRTPARCPRTSPWSEGGAGESYTLVPLWHSTFWLQPLGWCWRWGKKSCPQNLHWRSTRCPLDSDTCCFPPNVEKNEICRPCGKAASLPPPPIDWGGGRCPGTLWQGWKPLSIFQWLRQCLVHQRCRPLFASVPCSPACTSHGRCKDPAWTGIPRAVLGGGVWTHSPWCSRWGMQSGDAWGLWTYLTWGWSILFCFPVFCMHPADSPIAPPVSLELIFLSAMPIEVAEIMAHWSQ